MRSSFLPKCQPKIGKMSVLPSNKLSGQKSFQFLVAILGETMISYIHSEFNWPLDVTTVIWSGVSVEGNFIFAPIHSKVTLHSPQLKSPYIATVNRTWLLSYLSWCSLFVFSDDRVFLLFHRNLSDALTQLAQGIYAVLSRESCLKNRVNKVVKIYDNLLTE